MTARAEPPSLWDALENHGTDPCVWQHEECALPGDTTCSRWPRERWTGLDIRVDHLPPARRRVAMALITGPQCATDLGQSGQRFGARIHELRRAGYVIERRPCRRPFHRHPINDRLDEYVLVAIPGGTTE